MWHFINSIRKYVCFVSQASERAAENGAHYPFKSQSMQQNEYLQLIETCYLISVHCILSSCLISNWLAENKHSLKIIRETISVKADPKRPLLCKTCPFKVWSSEIPHVDWMKKTRMNRKKSTHWQEVLFRGMKWMKKWFVDTCYTEIEIWRLSIKET